MRRKFLKSGVSLLVCLALLFSMAATSAFAKAAGADTHNYQLRSGVYMGFDFLSWESYDFVGKFTVDTTKFDRFDVKKFTVSYTLRDETVDLGEYPSDSWDLRITGRTNYKEFLYFTVTLYGQNNQSYVVNSSFDLRQFEVSGIGMSEPRLEWNQEILVHYGSYKHAYVTYTYDGYSYESGGRPGPTGCFPLYFHTPIRSGGVLEVKAVLSGYEGGSCEIIRTFVFE